MSIQRSVARPVDPRHPRLRFIEGAPEGTGPADADEQEETDSPDAQDAPDDEQTPEPGEDALGDPGKRALEATKTKWKAERAKRIALEHQLAEATAPKDGEPTPDQIRADAERAANERANARIVRADVKAAAAGLLEDPADALAFLDLTKFDVDDDGDTDADEIADAINDLIARKPHLKKTSTPQRESKRRVPEVPADPANTTSTPKSHADKVAAAKAAGDWAQVIALENELLNSK